MINKHDPIATDDQGRPIVVSQGIGGPGGDWGAFRVKPNGSLSRVRAVAMWPGEHEARENAIGYAKRKGWTIMEAVKEAPENTAPAILIDLLINRISPWKDNPRKSPGEAEIAELAASLRDVGPIQPIVVRPAMRVSADECVDPHAHYLLVCGERRYLAAQVAGLKTLPAIVRDMTREQALKIAIIENLQREDVNAIDEARSLDMLLKETDLTQEAVGEKIGKSQAYIANRVRLLELPEIVVDKISRGILSAGHGKALLKYKRWPVVVEKIAEHCEEQEWSVHRLESASMWNFGLPPKIARSVYGDDCKETKGCADFLGEFCFNSACFNKKQAPLKAKEKAEREKQVEKIKAKGVDIPDLNSFRKDHECWRSYRAGEEPEAKECRKAGCEKLKKGYNQWSQPDIVDVCLDPKCFHEKGKARAAGRNANAKEVRSRSLFANKSARC